MARFRRSRPYAPDPARHGPPTKRLHTPIHQYPELTAFLDTQELLEMALKLLQPRDLLQLQGVNKHFRVTINGSSMKQSLFLESNERQTSTTLAPESITEWRLNDAIFAFPNSLSGFGALSLLADPLITSDCDSRLSMFLTQPPCKTVSITVRSYKLARQTRNAHNTARTMTAELDDDLKVSNGVTLKDIVDYFKAWSAAQEDGWKLNLSLSWLSIKESTPLND